MKKYKRLYCIFLIPFFVSANQMSSTFFTCYKENKNAMQVAACLDNANRHSLLQLDKAERKLLQLFSKLDQINGNSRSVNALNNANLRFKSWKEAQCRMVEASFQTENSRKQAYLGCLIDLTEEQVRRMQLLSDMEKN